MIVADLAPFAGTVGGGFLIGFVTGYAWILSVDWEKVQAVSQNAIDWVATALTHIPSTIGGSHLGTVSNIGIPLV